jgi:glycosyltransferase involved in cell wall biosynthesis
MKNKVDLFICCHPQSDPSCTYLETLGCGVPIVGYRNQAFEGIIRSADVGSLVKIGDVEGLANEISTLAAQPQIIEEKARNAIAMAQKHNFETEFAARMAQLKAIAQLGDQRDGIGSGLAKAQ